MTEPDLRQRFDAFDWASTALGSRENWPRSLRVVVELVLASAFPMTVLWGEELIQIYNDGYAVILGGRHPAALGQPMRQVWPEVWHLNGPLYRDVWQGQTFYFENQLYPITRHGFPEEAYFTLCYSPVRGDDGAIGGVLVTVSETTAQVLAARRLETAGALAQRLAQAATVAMIREVAQGAASSPDVSTARLYLPGDPDFAAAPPTSAQDGPDQPAPPALALPLGAGEPGVLVLGLNPQTVLNAAYRGFLAGYAGQVGAALARARSREQAAALAEQLDAEREALAGFAAYTEAVSTETDVIALARVAIEVLGARFPGSDVAYYEREAGIWKAQEVSRGMSPELAAALRAGLPRRTPVLVQALEQRRAVFRDDWNSSREGVAYGVSYDTVGMYPLIVEGEVLGLFGVGILGSGPWRERDQALFRAVGRGLNLALERAEQTRRLAEEREALSAFAAFTEAVGSETDVTALMARAITLLDELLGVEATYFERDGGLYTIRQWPEGFSPALLARSQRGYTLDYPDVAQAAATRQAVFVDDWRTPERGVPESAFYRALAYHPFFRQGVMAGVLVMGHCGQAHWTERERGIFRAVGRGLGLALERATQAAALMREKQKLEEANAELEAFNYSVSHDLMTPVRHIRGFSELLHAELGGRVEPEAGRHLDVVRQAAGRLDAMIDTLLGLSRTSRRPLRFRPVNLTTLAGQVQAAFGPQLAGRTVRWVNGPLPTLSVDQETIQLVLVQLLGNALKATRSRAEAVIELWAEDAGDEWRISVRDNGLGFDPRYRERLFRVFQRLHREDEFDGNGAGLAAVQRIVARHRGTVSAQGQVGQGATFGFTLPKDGPAA